MLLRLAAVVEAAHAAEAADKALAVVDSHDAHVRQARAWRAHRHGLEYGAGRATSAWRRGRDADAGLVLREGDESGPSVGGLADCAECAACQKEDDPLQALAATDVAEQPWSVDQVRQVPSV